MVIIIVRIINDNKDNGDGNNTIIVWVLNPVDFVNHRPRKILGFGLSGLIRVVLKKKSIY